MPELPPPPSLGVPADGERTEGAPRPAREGGTASAVGFVPVRLLFAVVDVVQYAVVLSLLVLASVVLVRSLASFLTHPAQFPDSVVSGLDGVLVVIIILDILRTVLSHFEGTGFPVRPFLVIGILASVRDVLSASAHLTLQAHLTPQQFNQALVELVVAVGVVAILLGGLAVLRWAAPDEPAGAAGTRRPRAN